MTSYAWNTLLARRVRLALTMLGIVLGVALVAGTLTLTDGIHAGFDRLFHGVDGSVDVVVARSNATASTVSVRRPSRDDDRTVDPDDRRMPPAIVDSIARVDGVAKALALTIDPDVQLLRRSGEPVARSGAATQGFSWAGTDALNPIEVTRGHAPRRNDEVVVDARSLATAGLHLGDHVRILFRAREGRFRIVGVVAWRGGVPVRGATVAAVTPLAAANWFGSRGYVDTVRVRADRGTPPATLRGDIDDVLGPRFRVVSGATAARDGLADVARGLGSTDDVLLAFGAIALLVGAFTIFDTFSIIVAHRGRELALLRALGATRRQVTGVVLLEAALLGVAGSVLGLGAGLLLARALRRALDAVGASFPDVGLDLHPRTVVTSLALGVVVTLLAALVPALRAARVSPMAALRDTGPGAGHLRVGTLVLGSALLALGAGLLGAGLFSGGTSERARFGLLGAGFTLAIIGVALLAPLVVRPVVALLSWPFVTLGSAVVTLASANATRNTSRTATTASALMVGIGLAAFAAVFAASVSTTAAHQVDRAVVADLAVTPRAGDATIDPALTASIADLPQLGEVAGVREAGYRRGGARGDRARLLAVDPPALRTLLHLTMRSGSASGLRDGTILVDETEARDLGLHRGSSTRMYFSAGRSQTVTVAGIYADTGLASRIVPIATYARQYPGASQVDTAIYAARAPHTSLATARAAVARALAGRDYLRVQDRAQLRDVVRHRTDRLLAMVWGLLSLSLLIALLGIANTLLLSVHERTRELGLLRAVGMTRAQSAGVVLVEALFIALVGSLLGLVFGIGLGWAGVRALASKGLELDIPVATIVLLALAGAAAGLVAATPPAVRATRLRVLEAIAAE